MWCVPKALCWFVILCISFENCHVRRGQVTQRFVMTKHDVDKAAELQMSKNIEMDARSTKIEERLDLLEARSVTTDAKLDRILLLQGNLLDRLQSIETRVDRVEQKNNVRDLEVAQALKSAAEAVEEVSNSKAQVKDSFSYFDDEVKYLKVYSRRINEDLKQFMGLFTEQSGKSKGVAKELKKRLDSLTEIVDLNVDGDPTPEELYQIYMSYEECVVKSQHKGKTSTAFPKDIAITLSKYAYRLAAFVAREVELDMLFGVISGPQPPPATSAAHHPAGAGVGSGVPIPESTPEEDVLRNREIFLQKFNNSYLELFTVVAHHLGAQTGIARSEARAVFHRRFIAAVESALSKHDVLVMETAPSLIGKSNKDSKNATCVSCDRPLNAPRYKSNKSWQQALLLHQMPNGHPATGLADKKAAESPQKMRPKSAQPISSASPSTLVALSSIQKSMGTDFGMPSSKTEDIPIAEVPDLGPTHRIPMVAVGTIEESSIEGHVENIAIASKYDDDIPESQKAESLTANNESLASAMLTLRSRSPIADERKAESRFVLDDGGGANAMVRSSSAKSTNRPASATSRHKTAIQDAYVLRGGFKMKVQKPQNNQNSDVFADVRNSQSTPSLNPYDATKGTLNTNPSNAPKSSIQTSSNPNLSASGVGVQ